MIDVFNLFILFLFAGAAWLGVSAVVQKRTVQRRRDDPARQAQTHSGS